MASKVVAGGQGWEKQRTNAVQAKGKICWIDEVNGKSKSEISSQLNQFEPEPWCLYVSLESALRS